MKRVWVHCLHRGDGGGAVKLKLFPSVVDLSVPRLVAISCLGEEALQGTY